MALDFILHCIVVLHACAVAMIRPSHTLLDMSYYRAETSDAGVGSGSRRLSVDRYGFRFSTTL
jgi:hypothetical protein